MNYHLAQINVGRMQGKNIEDPVMWEFVQNLDRINALAEKSHGFVWRLKDDSNNATHYSPYRDDRVIINLSVWQDIKSLKDFTYNSMHVDFIKQRRKWFEKFGRPYLALWWIPTGHRPTIVEAIQRLDHLQTVGPSVHAFNFVRTFGPFKD